MIIIEGPDGSGKTTLATELADQLQVPLVHSPGPKEEWLTSVFNYHVAQPRRIVIYDRCYFSEFVYGPLLRGGVAIPPWLVEYAEKVWLPTIKPLVIFCDPGTTHIREGLRGRDQMIGVQENIEKISEGYRDYFSQNQNDFRLFNYNWTTGSYQNLLIKVQQWVNKRLYLS